jgi:hypothetical protein
MTEQSEVGRAVDLERDLGEAKTAVDRAGIWHDYATGARAYQAGFEAACVEVREQVSGRQSVLALLARANAVARQTARTRAEEARRKVAR